MDPLLLRFVDGAIERRYDECMLRRQLWRIDSWFMTLSTPFVLSPALGNLCRILSFLLGKEGSPPVTELDVASTLSSLFLALFWFVKWRWGIQGMLQRRTQLVVAFRICVSVSLALSMQKFQWMYELQENYIWAAFDALVINEVLGALVIGFGLRLKFRYHVWTSFFSILALFVGKGNTFCEKITCSPEGHGFMLAERRADSYAGRVMDWLHYGSGENLSKDRSRNPCLQLSLFIHLFFAFGMVSYWVWLTERRSRVNFAMQDNCRGNARGLSSLRHIPFSTHIQHGAISLVAFGVAWEFLFKAGEFLQRWGFAEKVGFNDLFDHVGSPSIS
ncbi:hypothetical protein BSKO_05730 [Bryopsis sp. KO-2023]|nr:hypothetical protein BSKO_05730 [Bryopsis sp. KO-2023]